jgi:hypothetical protein
MSPIKLTSLILLLLSAPLHAQYENPPILSAQAILQPAYYQGQYFKVRDAVPTYAGANAYTIDSDFGVFEAYGNDMLMRRVAEIYAIAVLRQVSSTKEFEQGAKKAAESPLIAARDLVTNPVGTISGVPEGIWKMLNVAGQSVKEIGEGRKTDSEQGNLATNMIGFSKVKRDIALRLCVDPYSTNQVLQKELNKVAWPAFAGGFTVDLGMAAAGAGIGAAGVALAAVDWTGHLNNMLRDNSPTDLRLINLKLLLAMGLNRADADAFLNNNAISPTTQTILVGSLNQLATAIGRDQYIRQATTSSDEQDALFYQQCAQLMALVNNSVPVTLITQINGLPVCQLSDGMVIVPIQWDYVAWTPAAGQFLTALQSATFPKPPTGYAVILTGVVSPLSATTLATAKIRIDQKQLATPLN